MNLTDRSAVIDTLLPDDPEDGHIYTLPEGQTVGGAQIIYLFKGGVRIGTAQALAAVNNVSGKHVLDRVVTTIDITKGSIIHLKAFLYSYTAVRFVQYYGWIGCNPDENHKTVIADKHYRVVDSENIGFGTPGHNVYEKVCLEVIKEEK